MTKFTVPRGTHDILPADQPIWQHVVAEAERLCALYAYRRIQTPAFEETALFQRTSGAGSDIVQKEMYTFTDRAERSLTLRPEATAPIVRAYLEHGLPRQPQPQKLYTIAPMYRYAAPQRGRYREHWQLSVEAIGSADPALDAEVIQLYDALARALGVRDFTLQLNSIGDRSCRPAYIARLSAWLDDHEQVLDEDARQKRVTSPLRVFDVKNPTVLAALEEAPKIGESLCPECRAHFESVQSYLRAASVPFELTPTLVRGLDYYTRTTFEFVDSAIGSKSTICGGGRYDGLAEELGGPGVPGIGFGAGIERLLISLEVAGVAVPQPALDAFIVAPRSADLPVAPVLDLLRELRGSGLSADIDYAGRSLRGQETQAKRLGAKTTVFYEGESCRLRRTGAEDVSVPTAQLLEELRR